jgi:hypothetical protein
MGGVKNAPPSYIQSMTYDFSTDFLGMGWGEVEGIIHEVEMPDPSLLAPSDPMDNRL